MRARSALRWNSTIRRTCRLLYERAFGGLLSRWSPGNVVMLHIGRSGSTVLLGMLGQHPRIRADGERLQYLMETREITRRSMAAPSRQEIEAYLRRQSRLAGNRFNLVSVKFYHLEALGLCVRCLDGEIFGFAPTKFILLERRNYLRKVVSSLIAKESGIYHVPSGHETSAQKVRVDPDLVAIDGWPRPLVEFLEEFDRSYHEAKQLLPPEKLLLLTYEEDVGPDTQVGYQRICDFLGIAAHNPRIPTGVQNPYPLRELIENFEEVESVLSGGPYEWMLYK